MGGRGEGGGGPRVGEPALGGGGGNIESQLGIWSFLPRGLPLHPQSSGTEKRKVNCFIPLLIMFQFWRNSTIQNLLFVRYKIVFDSGTVNWFNSQIFSLLFAVYFSSNFNIPIFLRNFYCLSLFLYFTVKTFEIVTLLLFHDNFKFNRNLSCAFLAIMMPISK